MTLRRTKSMTTKLIPILAVATLVACCANAQPKMELKDLKQKASYSIGADIASNMKKQEIDIDVKSLTAGFSDAFAGGKMLLTEAEMKERKALIEDAKSATQAALAEGIVPGGGVALLRSEKSIEKLDLEGDEKLGASIVKNSLRYPLEAIATNAGVDGPVVVNRVRHMIR